jgi:hypothetical protein
MCWCNVAVAEIKEKAIPAINMGSQKIDNRHIVMHMASNQQRPDDVQYNTVMQISVRYTGRGVGMRPN